ncbi:CCA tRNA nucleotidyltransferase, mitochondrial, partial [Modicella reniformis]
MTSGGTDMEGTVKIPRLEIQLTQQEAQICEVLDTVSRRYEEKENKKVQLRIAGGWVRDKLLGLTCHDLDIAIDTMMGYDFAVLVNNFLETQGQEKRSIARIATNPEKSKHLETATMIVLGKPLDFVNLQDAYRRDFTINTLFYNVHTRSVEDFTGKGLDDLKNGLVRTPLEPYETFWQDPLRVMRCIRFAARFHFKVDQAAKLAILNTRIKQALMTKISKERIGGELDKMIEDGVGRSTAIRLLRDLDLYDVVFAPPKVDDTPKGTTAIEGKVRDPEDAFKLVWIIEWLLKINPPAHQNDDLEGRIFQAEIDLGQETLLSQTRGTPFTSHLYSVIRTIPPSAIAHIASKEEPFPEKLTTRNLILTGMLYPYRDMSATVNKKSMSAGAWILRFGLKGKNNDIDIMTKLMESLDVVHRTVHGLAQSPAMDEVAIQEERTIMGMAIRDIGYGSILGKKWPSAFLLGLALDLIPRFEQLQNGVLDNETRAQIA